MMIEEAYLKKVEDVLRSLQVRADAGLSEKRVRLNRKEYGRNVLPHGKRRSPLVLFFERLICLIGLSQETSLDR